MKKLTTQEFIFKSIKIHGNKYDYSKVEYTGIQNKVVIICPIHGNFPQRPDKHLNGQGCSYCYNDKRTSLEKDVIIRFNTKHNFKYLYTKTKYKNIRTKVIITCPIEGHGDFKQNPQSHLNGNGCPKCANEKREGGYQSHKALIGQYNGSGYLYKIRMYNEVESFIKIGVSVNPKQRIIFLRNYTKYNIEIIETKFYKNFNLAIIEEHKLHEKYKECSYIPIKHFSGWTECFNESINISSLI